MTSIYDVIDLAHSEMDKIESDIETQHDSIDATHGNTIFHITRDCVFFETTGAEWVDHNIIDEIEGSIPWRERVAETETLYLGDRYIALREDGNWVDDLVQKYFE